MCHGLDFFQKSRAHDFNKRGQKLLFLIFFRMGFVARNCDRLAIAEEIAFALRHEVLAGGSIGEIETVFVYHHRLQTRPVGPSLLAHVFPDAHAEFAGERRIVKALGLFM